MLLLLVFDFVLCFFIQMLQDDTRNFQASFIANNSNHGWSGGGGFASWSAYLHDIEVCVNA